MKIHLTKILLIVWILSISTNALATPKLTNKLIKNIATSYGYYFGQKKTLDKIKKTFPTLSNDVYIVENEFLSAFQTSIQSMDTAMTKSFKPQWEDIKNQIAIQNYKNLKNTRISYKQALQFIALVKKRANGEIQNPILETYLLFKSRYETHPEREFLDGYKYTYKTDGLGKSKGLMLSIEIPKTWMASEGKHPNIIQKFTSKNGQGIDSFMMQIKEFQLKEGELVTEKDVMQLLNSSEMKNILPYDSKYINSGKMTLETLPGYWVKFETNASRVRRSATIESIMYAVYYKDKVIQFIGQVTTSVDGVKQHKYGLEKYERLFDLIVNSLIINNLWVK